MVNNYAMSSGDWIEFSNVQLELGSVATEFEHRSYGEELALCQRYGWMIGTDFELTAQGTYWSGNYHYITINFPTTMRTPPTLSYSRAGALDLFGAGSHTQSTALSLAGGGPTMCELQGTFSQTPSSSFIRTYASSDWLFFDAEL